MTTKLKEAPPNTKHNLPVHVTPATIMHNLSIQVAPPNIKRNLSIQVVAPNNKHNLSIGRHQGPNITFLIMWCNLD